MRGEGVSDEQLETMYRYWYVQAAVDGRQVDKVVSTLQDRLARLG